MLCFKVLCGIVLLELKSIVKQKKMKSNTVQKET